MKVAIGFVSLAILAGVMAAPYAWDPNTVYTYRVQSRFAAGMLGLEGPSVDDTETDRALVELTWQVEIYQKQPNQIYMNPSNFQAVIAKAQIHPREEPISSQKEVAIPQKYQQLLEKVLIVNLDPKSGVPDSFVVRADEPLTATEKNIKRAQVQAFIMNPGTSKLIVKGNVNRQTNSVRPSEQDDDSGFFYKVMEESIHGECQTYYQVSQTGPHQSLYQLEAQDVPVQDDQESQEQPANPRFSNFQKQQQQWQQQQQQWKAQGQHQSQNEINQDAQQQPWPQAYQQFCNNNEQVYLIQKTVNLTACKDRPVLSTTLPAELVDCRPGDNTCGSLWSHVVNTRFVACGESRQDFTILEVNQEERFVYGLRNDQNIDGYAVKNVTLQQKQRTNANPAAAEMQQQGQNQYTVQSLVFQFDVNEQQKQLGQEHQHPQQWQQKTQKGKHQHQQDSDSDSEEDYPQGSNGQSIKFPLQSQKPSLENPPLRPQLITAVASPPQLQQRALALLQEAAHNILDPRKSIPEGETIALQSVLAKTLRYMTKQQQKEVYEQAVQNNQHDQELQSTVQNILLDAMAASGTNPSLVAIMELIEAEQVTGSQANQLVMTFAHYSRHPTKQFLQRFHQFTKHPAVQNHTDLRTTAILALSALFHQACVNAEAKQASFSYALYGPFCQLADTEEFVEQATTHLQKALKKSEKEHQQQGRSKSHEVTLHLAALGNVGHPKVVKIVQQILDDSNDVGEKTKAIYALKNVIRSQEDSNPIQEQNGNVDTEQNQNEVDRVEADPVTDAFVENKVLPLLVSVALDNTEHPSVRIAAVQMLTYSTYADATIWQQLAMSTWFTTSQEYHHFVATTIEGLADLESAPSQIHEDMITNARAALPLVKPVDTESYARSTNTFATGEAPHLASQFFRQLSWIGSRDSAWPTSVYFRNTVLYGSGAVAVNPLEVAVNFRTFQQVFEKLADNFGSSSSEESGEKNQYMQQILKNVLPREMQEQPQGSVYVNLRNGIQRLWQIENVEEYLSWKNVAQFLALRRGVPFNYQKTIQLASQTIEFPTILGLPMSFKLRVPAMISLRGKAKLNGAQFQAEIDAVAGYKRHAKIALKIPYLQRKLESGLQSHFVAQTPFRITISQRSDQPIVVAVTPTTNINGTASGQIELATFHRQPYVAIVTDELYPSVHIKGGQMTVLRTLDAPTTNENHYQNVLGFAVSTKEESDYRPEEETQEGWMNHMSNFEDAETFAHLGYAGGPEAKYASRKVTLNVDESQAKTLVLLVAAKRGSGSIDQSFDTDASSSSSSSSSTSESDSSDSSDSSSEEAKKQQQNRQARQYNQQGQQQDSSSSSSSSSESDEASNSNENSAEVFQKGGVWVVAVVAKKEEIPPVSRSAAATPVNLLQAAHPNQQQLILQISKRTDKFFVRFAQGAAAEEAARSLPSNSNSISKLADAMIAPDYQGQQAEFCAEVAAKIQYPKHAHPRLLVALREALLNNDLNVQVQARAQFAHTCKNEDLQQNEITVNGQLQREANMTEWARTKSPEAQQCQEDEAQGFSVSDDCLAVAAEQASALNQARLNVQWTEGLPEALQQAVYTAVDAAKATYQAHAYHDRFPENPANGNQAIVTLQITPDGEFWSASVLTNETELQLQNIPSNEAIQAAFPLSAIQSVAQNIEDAWYGDDSQPTCQLEGKSISSFDNVVDQIDTSVAQGCYHLLTADGSGEDTWAVLAKNVGTDNVKLQVILSQTKIQLATQRSIPRARASQVEKANEIVATVNGQSVALPYTVRKQGQRSESNDYVARIQAHPSGGVQVLTPKNDIAFDGSKIVIFADDSYRNQTIGMCGDFDGEKVADRRSRKDIPLSDATLLYANYAYDVESSSQCNVNQQTQQQIKQEEALAKARGKPQASRSQQQQAWKQQSAWQNPQNQQDSSEEAHQQPAHSRH